MLDRQVLQMIVTKLDTNAVTLKYAKDWISKTYGIKTNARSKASFIKEVSNIVKSNEC